MKDYKKMHEKLQHLSKAFLTSIIGAVSGVLLAVLYTLIIWLPPTLEKNIGGLIVLPIVLIVLSILGSILGGGIAFLGYYIVHALKVHKG